jgi:outer membrane murein-binding lipoprotein Lpp
MPHFYLILVAVLLGVTLIGGVITRRGAAKKRKSEVEPLNPELRPVPPLVSPVNSRSEQLGNDLTTMR